MTDQCSHDDAVAINFGEGALASTDDDQSVILANMMSTDFAQPGQVHTFNASRTGSRRMPTIDPDMDGDQSIAMPKVVAGYLQRRDGNVHVFWGHHLYGRRSTMARAMLTAASEGWIFTPAEGATSDVADAEYLHYGFWLMRTTKDGATTYNEVETFAEATGFGADTTGEGLHSQLSQVLRCIKVARLVCM